jgi:hypothetical protein
MTKKQPEGLLGFAGQPDSYKMPNGTEIPAGDIVYEAFALFSLDVSREGMTEESDRAAWNNLTDDERLDWCVKADHKLSDEIEAESEIPIPADAVQRSAAKLVGDRLIAVTIDELKQLERPWAQMKQLEQQLVLDRVARNAVKATQEAARLIATQAQAHIVGELEQITIKDSAKATITLARGQINEEALEAVGNQVIILLAGSLPERTVEIETPKATEDQGHLPLGDQAGVEHSDPED